MTDCTEEIAKELARLKGATESQLQNYNNELSRKRAVWFESRRVSEVLFSGDTLEAAYRLLCEKFGAALEACIILGLDTRKVCKMYNEKATDDLIKLVDPGLRFDRNYEKLRPYSPYCEEMILREEDDTV